MEVFAVNPMPSVFSLAASAFEEKKKHQCRRSLSPRHLGRRSLPLVLCSCRVSPWQRMRKQVVLFKTQTLGSTLIWEGCDKQSEPEPKSLQIEQHETW